jgi:hypothetical protein
VRLVIDESCHQGYAVAQSTSFLLSQSRGDSVFDPRISRASEVNHRSTAGGADLDEHLTTIGGIGVAFDEPGLEQLPDGVRHGLRAHSFQGCKLAGRGGATTHERAEDVELRLRDLAVLPEPADQLGDHDSEFLGLGCLIHHTSVLN